MTKGISTLKKRPDLSPHLEKVKAASFLKEIKASIEAALHTFRKANGPVNYGQLAYAYLDVLFDNFTQDDRDFGWLISYESSEAPYTEDIMYGAKLDAYRGVVDQHSAFMQEDHDYFTREGLFKVFWNLLAKNMMQALPMSDEAFVAHIERAVLGMFTGDNFFGLVFELRYVEGDPDNNGELYVTAPLNEHLLAPAFSF